MTRPRPETLESEREPLVITLADAARYYGITVSTLRAEADRGRLTIYKIGKRYCTTPADIREMVRQCRVEPKAQDSTWSPRKSSGSSETDRASSALAAANETVRMLRSSSRNTLGASTSQSRQVRR